MEPPPIPACLRRMTWLVVAGLVGCCHLPHTPRDFADDAPPPPLSLRPVFGAWGFRATRDVDRSDETLEVVDFEFETYSDELGGVTRVSGELYRPIADTPSPLIAVSPILGGALGGYLECRIFGRQAAARGYASYFLHQEGILLKPYESATDLEAHMRTWVRSMIKSLDVLLQRYSFDTTRLGTFGISLGGMRTVLLAAAEPRFQAHVVCMAGGDLEQVMSESRENLVQRYVQRRQERLRVARERVTSDFRSNFPSDPVNVARYVDPQSVLCFIARLDDKVPVETGWLLHEALGRPECRTAPTGHYTSIVVLPWAISHSYEFFGRRFESRNESRCESTLTCSADSGGEDPTK